LAGCRLQGTKYQGQFQYLLWLERATRTLGQAWLLDSFGNLLCRVLRTCLRPARDLNRLRTIPALSGSLSPLRQMLAPAKSAFVQVRLCAARRPVRTWMKRRIPGIRSHFVNPTDSNHVQESKAGCSVFGESYSPIAIQLARGVSTELAQRARRYELLAIG